MNVADRLRRGSRRTGALIGALGIVTACGAAAMALGPALVGHDQPALYTVAAVVFILGALAGAVGRWVFRNGAEDVVQALQSDPQSIVSVEYKLLRSYQLFRPDGHHLVFRLRSGRTTVSVLPVDIGPILDEVRTRAPHAGVSRVERYGPA